MYFFVDTLSVFISSIVFTGQLRWLAVLQIIQHMYYFLWWDKTSPAKKVTRNIFKLDMMFMKLWPQPFAWQEGFITQGGHLKF